MNAEEKEVVKAGFDQPRGGQFPSKHDSYWVAKDGTRKFIRWSNTALLDSRGAVKFVAHTGIETPDPNRP